MIKAEMFEPNDYKYETPAMQLYKFINNKKIKSYTLVEEDTTYWCPEKKEYKSGKLLVLIYEEGLENEK